MSRTHSIWFKQCYVKSIMDGTKCDTIRRDVSRLSVGDLLRFSVGPRAPFAHARVTEIEQLLPDQIEQDRYLQLVKFYGALACYWRVAFELVEESTGTGE